MPNSYQNTTSERSEYTSDTSIPLRKVYNIDFDGTLTEPSPNFSDLKPCYRVIARVRELYFDGHIIIVWSARLWEDARKVAAWLTEWGVPYHGLRFDKGGSDHYVDDKALLIGDLLTKEGTIKP